MKIKFHVLPGGEDFSLKVSPSETIRDVKEKVQNCHGIPIYRQILHHNQFDLRDEWTVWQCDIHHGTSILLLVKDEHQSSPSQMVPNPLPPPPSTVALKVKMPRSQDRIPIEMELNETILHLKVKIAARQDMLGVPVERIVLQSPSMPVEWHDDKALRYILFTESADIDVFLRPS